MAPLFTGLDEECTMKDKRLYHTVADQIMELINKGAFPPGSRLPGERELAERFDVSRVTIREAEIALQALGHIKIKTGSGVYVLDRSEKGNGGLPGVTAFELTEARLLFESEGAALAARNIDDEGLRHLDELIERMSSSDPADEEDSQRADQEFHLAIAAASKNAAVLYIVETLWKMRTEIAPVREVHAAICAQEDATERGSEHAGVLEALKNRDPGAAREAMQKHFERLLSSMIDVTEEQALREVQQQVSASRQRFLKTAESS
jgi:DNA-binding FadR family transcriptional regulator